MKTAYAPQKDLINEFERDKGFSYWINPIDIQAAAECPCECCGFSGGLGFKGYQGYGERHAISVCPKCGDQQEF